MKQIYPVLFASAIAGTVLFLPAPCGAGIDPVGVVEALAGPSTRGRAPATDLEAAARFLESELARYGEVERQTVTVDGVESSNLFLLREPAVEGAGWVVLGAHYDHLGLGEAGDANEGKVHPGADDNASGCAVLLRAAELLLEAPPTERGLAFVFFTGEERGRLGSVAFVDDGPLPATDMVAMINLDTVGRLAEGGLTVFGVSSSRVFAPALQGINSVFGLELQTVDPGSGASDDMSFVEVQVPALHLFTGAMPEYHRPTDTPALIDYDGLEQLGEFTAELVAYLAQDDTELAFVAPAAAAALADPARATEGKRRVSFGSIPDFKFEGEGVRISGVLPGSPAAAAGLQEGDLITAFAGIGVSDLTDYSEAMKLHAPGDVVTVEFLREGEAMQAEVALAERR